MFHPFDWLWWFHQICSVLFCVTASPKMFRCWRLKSSARADVVFCGCKIPGRFTWIMAPKSSEKLWVQPLVCVCVWCFLAPLRWGPISSPLPPPISSAYTKKLIFQTSSNSKIKLNYKYSNIFKPVVVLFFSRYFSSTIFKSPQFSTFKLEG